MLRFFAVLVLYASSMGCGGGASPTATTTSTSDTSTTSTSDSDEDSIRVISENISTEQNFQITWNTVPEVTGYMIVVSSVGDCTQADQIFENVQLTSYSLNLDAVGTYLVCVFGMGEGNEVLSQNSTEITITQNTAPSRPLTFTVPARHGTLTESPTFTWSAVDALDLSHYEISVGSVEGGTNIVPWTNVGNVTEASLSSLTLESGKAYFANIRSVDKSGLSSLMTLGSSWQNLECPTGYIKIHGNETPFLGGSFYPLGTKSRYLSSEREISDFCVMQYEAKDAGGGTWAERAVSQASGTPWVTIALSQAAADNDATEACSAIGTGYSLINNAQWQAIARDIISLDVNWLNGDSSSTSSYVNYGNADSIIGVPCDGQFEYVDDSCGDDVGQAFLTKRTHSLSSGEVIWDFSGNVYEWVLDGNDPVNDASTNGYGGSGGVNSDPYSDEEGPAGSNKLMFGAAGDFSSYAVNNSGFGDFINGLSAPFFRGGTLNEGDASGIFAVTLEGDATYTNGDLGFRCVYAP